jgi:serine protease AprX
MTKRLALLAGALLAGTPLFAQAVVDPALRAALRSNPTAEVIVTFQGNSGPQPLQLTALQLLGITRGVSFRSLPIVGGLATAAQVQALAQRNDVRSIYLNKRLTYYNYNDTHLTGVKHLRTDATLIARNNGVPVSGKGVGVMINDSGVDGTHDDVKLGSHLVQNVLGSINLNSLSALLPVTYLENVPNTDTNSGHGTHCAGSVGGNGAKSSGKYEGVAPGASLIGYGSGGALFILDAIGGYDYALTHQAQYNIRVISNSWGTSGDFDPENPVNLISKKAYDRGIVSVFAAGNDGPGSDTHNPYAIAPWVISVGAGDKNGKLADFSSRGVKNEGGAFTTADGQAWRYENRPSIVAPGVDVVSTRALAPVSTLGAQLDAETLTPAELPFYTNMSGTSMATPHVAGIVALLLEAKPSLSPAQVKQILERTATNMPGREPWEVGAGYVNAYAAVDYAFRSPAFGPTVNLTRSFNSSVNAQLSTQPFVINYNPALTAGNTMSFQVGSGVTSLEAKITAGGVSGQTGNPLNLILTDPNGVEYRAGIPAAFALYTDRSVAAAAPAPGTWTLRVEGLQGVAFPETVNGQLTMLTTSGTTGLADIAGHPAEAAIKAAVAGRLVDGLSNGYRPNDPLTRLQLADYLLMGQAGRQYLPTTGSTSFTDVTGTALLLAESVTATGATLRDREHAYRGVMLPVAGRFAPNSAVNRAALAYSLVQGLGLQPQALGRNGQPVTVSVDGRRIVLDDAAQIPAGLEGYVSLALELGLINAYYTVAQGPYDLAPTLHASFKPAQTVTRGEFAVIVTRTFGQWDAVTQPAARGVAQSAAAAPSPETGAYPNPFVNRTTIRYQVPQEGFVTVEVYNLLGRKVQTLVATPQSAGAHEVQFDGQGLARGNYVFRVRTAQQVTSKQLVLQ